MKITDSHIYFWDGPFSQWFYRENLISYKGLKFSSAEKFMMFKKAELFQDLEILEVILELEIPRNIKTIGKVIRNFNDEIWDKHKLDIVTEGNYLKFLQNPDLYSFIEEHKEKIIVEASPVDKIWGIGLHFNNPDCLDDTKWQGQNLLGKAIMRAREQLFN
jgi:ribA/ribD-fused uncharacterized protein